MRVVAARSEHPLPPHAVGECLGQLLEAGGAGADALVVLLAPSLGGAAEDVAVAARSVLVPGVTLCAAVSRAALGRGGSTGSAVVALGLWGEGRDGCWVRAIGDEPAPGGTPVLLDVVGGAPGFGPSGIVLGPGWRARWSTVPGVAPVGPTRSVSGADRSLLWSLGGEPALDVVTRALTELPEHRLAGVADAVRLEVAAADPHLRTLRRIRGVDRDRGALVLDGDVQVGTSVRLVLCDDEAMSDDLRRTLSGGSAAAAWVFAPEPCSPGALAGVVEDELVPQRPDAPLTTVLVSTGSSDSSGITAGGAPVRVLLVG